MQIRNPMKIISAPQGIESPLIQTHDVTRQNMGDLMNPFLLVSLFEMKGPVFPSHPHAGFAVMTYILPESETGFVNQDSTGFSNEIAPGDVHLTFAGSGLLHEETNTVEGQSAVGFQIWLDVPNVNRRDAPTATHLKQAEVKTLEDGTGAVRVLAGTSNGLSSKIDIPTQFRLIDVSLNSDASFEQDLSATETAYLYVISGAVSVGNLTAKAGEVLFTEPSGTLLAATAGRDSARFVLFAGEPLKQAPVFGGPFVASNHEELMDFKRAFASGAMGRLTAFADQTAV